MQIKAVIGQIALVGGALGLLFRAVGKDAAAESIEMCLQRLGPDSIELCRDAAREVVKASKQIYDQALAFTALAGGYLNLFSNSKGKKNADAKAELDKKVFDETHKKKLP